MFEFDPTVLLAVILINLLWAYSQSVALKAGVFSVATVGLVAVGAYVAAFLVTKEAWSPLPAALLGVAASVVFAGGLALPLSRLRGIYAAVATLAFVTIVQTAADNFTGFTGGANGLDGISRYINWPGLLVVGGACAALLTVLYRSRIGLRFEMLRQDEAVAATQGVSAARTQFVAFVFVGLFAGVGGVCYAYYNYAVFPESFSFTVINEVLVFVYLGGFRSWRGPVLGTVILTALPEMFVSLASWTMIVNGAILVAVVVFLPQGVIDSLELWWRARRLEARQRTPNGGNLVEAGAPVAAVAEAVRRP